MKHLQGATGFTFIHEPEEFNKYTDKEFLHFCPGATMYMPAVKDFTKKILTRQMQDLTTIVMCFEDACPEDRVPEAEENVLRIRGKTYRVFHKHSTQVVLDEIVNWAKEGVAQLGCSPCTLAMLCCIMIATTSLYKKLWMKRSCHSEIL